MGTGPARLRGGYADPPLAPPHDPPYSPAIKPRHGPRHLCIRRKSKGVEIIQERESVCVLG